MAQAYFSGLKKIWFPGHMASAQKNLSKIFKSCDLIIEVRDARAPLASSSNINSSLAKPCLIVCNKKQLANQQLNLSWLTYFKQENQTALFCDLLKPEDTKKIFTYLKKKSTIKINRQKSIIKIPYRVIVIGIPNTGKSTLINRLINKKRVKVGDQPGLTRHLEWVKINDNLELLDSPGVLSPNVENLAKNLLFTLIYSTKNESLNLADSVDFLLELLKFTPEKDFLNRYKLNLLDLNHPKAKLLEIIIANLNIKENSQSASIIKARQTIINDFRNGYLGQLTLEKPPFNQ